MTWTEKIQATISCSRRAHEKGRKEYFLTASERNGYKSKAGHVWELFDFRFSEIPTRSCVLLWKRFEQHERLKPFPHTMVCCCCRCRVKLHIQTICPIHRVSCVFVWSGEISTLRCIWRKLKNSSFYVVEGIWRELMSFHLLQLIECVSFSWKKKSFESFQRNNSWHDNMSKSSGAFFSIRWKSIESSGKFNISLAVIIKFILYVASSSLL